MRDYELAALAFVAWVLLQDSSVSGMTLSSVYGVTCINDRSRFSFKPAFSKSINWGAIDFQDSWTPGSYHIFSRPKMESHRFEVIHTYDKNNVITFKLYGTYFEVEDNQGARLKIEIDSQKRITLIDKSHGETKLVYEVN